jgi:hypothetical protein
MLARRLNIGPLTSFGISPTGSDAREMGSLLKKFTASTLENFQSEYTI